MSSKHIRIALSVLTALAAVGTVAMIARAGDPDNPPGPPETTTSYTLEDIYNRLDTRAEATAGTFSEPSSAPPAGTMHTLNEIYQLIGERAPVPQTGQTTSYAPSDDGDLQPGVAWPTPRFTNNGDGTVTDHLTGLVWLQDAHCNTFFSGDTGSNCRGWHDSITATQSLADGYCGLTDGSSVGDWRLPTIQELQSLVDYGNSGFALPTGHPFNVFFQNYWSSTSLNEMVAWSINMYFGETSTHEKTWDPCIWPVRDAQ